VSGERLVPLHYKNYLVLRRQLLHGDFDAAAPLPSELQLAARFEVSRVTIRRTLARLEDERLVVRRHGVGTFPGEISRVGPAGTVPVGSLREQLVGPDAERRNMRLLSFRKVAPPPLLQTDRAAFGRRVLRIQRLSFHGPRPAHLATSYVHEDFAARIDRGSLGNRTVLEVLEAAGVSIDRAEVTITAAAADVFVAGQLGVSVGAPLLVTQRLTSDAQGRPVEYYEGVSRPDEYSLQFVARDVGRDAASGGRPLPWRAPG
jgi:GntR family transcriptional regulator